ncbi:hypothetical protein SALBM135S_02035 [Streptomyces alboniger]
MSVAVSTAAIEAVTLAPNARTKVTLAAVAHYGATTVRAIPPGVTPATQMPSRTHISPAAPPGAVRATPLT